MAVWSASALVAQEPEEMFGEDLGDLLWGRLLWPIDKAKAVLGYRPAHNFAEFLTALEAGDTGYYPRQASSPGGASEAPFPIPSAGLIRTRFPAQSSEPDCSRRRPVPSAWALLPRPKQTASPFGLGEALHRAVDALFLRSGRFPRPDGWVKGGASCSDPASGRL